MGVDRPFVNYYADAPTGSAVNTAVARVVIAALGIWKLVSYDWASIPEWPVYADESYVLVVPEWIQPYLVVEQFLALVGLVLFAAGFSHRYATPATAILLAHLGTARYLLDASGGSQALFTLVYFLVFFALYRREDVLSVDGMRADGVSLADLRSSVRAGDDAERSRNTGSILKWGLVAIGVLYFGSGVTKLVFGPGLEWVSAESLGRYVLWAQSYFGVNPEPGRVLLRYPLLVQAAAVGTVVLETGFLPWILAKRNITLFVVSLLSMHVLVAIVMGPFFFDQIVLLCLFVDWSRLLGRADRQYF